MKAAVIPLSFLENTISAKCERRATVHPFYYYPFFLLPSTSPFRSIPFSPLLPQLHLIIQLYLFPRLLYLYNLFLGTLLIDSASSPSTKFSILAFFDNPSTFIVP
ncbi:hypothetical protein K435DRAFT_74726 [Dendrothele bispora CBS 962.96]|uniref:Uncharacterized protein n=1 Tax=Dendrothele bispora (strain CBS 962.96) TaxID=1314807 RepID=A0A4S8KQA7_DENBC|nr:hypothetical protein K435DRAFT_74726 [Dendrothele bispora CBS 962.96]